MAGEKILLIDDDPFGRRVLGDILRFLKYAVVTTENDRDGIEKIMSVHFDLVLLDSGRHEREGIEFLKTVKSIKPHLGVILLCDDPSLDSVRVAIRSGAADFLSRQTTPEELNSAIGSALSSGEFQ